MSIIKYILKVIGILILGVLGALIFNFFFLPYMITNPYFERFQFVKDFKQGKIIVNPKESVYIQENSAIEDAIERVKKSVVAAQSTKLGLKSGLIVTSDGLLITLASAVPNNGTFNVFVQGEPVSFKVTKIDHKNNLALIKIDKNNLPTVGFADPDKIKLGQSVFLVATTSIKPFDTAQGRQDNWLSNQGIIRQIDQNTIKTNISEKSIVSGSPLFNSAGQLVGINFIDQEGKISAVPIQKIKEFLGL